MLNVINPLIENHSTSEGTQEQARKAYRKPELILLGDLRTLTLGGSPGVGDSPPTIPSTKPF